MHDVTAELVTLLELDVSKQRLDSTHIESNMAKFGRIRLMATAARRFLVQLKRCDEPGYGRIRESLRQRHEATSRAIFGWKKLDDDGVVELRRSVAEDLAYLVEAFRHSDVPETRAAYRMMAEVFRQQCEVVGGRVAIKNVRPVKCIYKAARLSAIILPAGPMASSGRSSRASKPHHRSTLGRPPQ